MRHIHTLMTAPNKLGLAVILGFWALISLAAIAASDELRAEGHQLEEDTLEHQVADARAYIEAFAARTPNWPPSRRIHRQAPQLAELLVTVARRYGLPYRALVVTARAESGFRLGVRGKRDKGDHGLLQVNLRHWGSLVEDLDLGTAEGQVEAGARVLREGLDACGDVEGAMAYYCVGSCKVAAGHRKASNVRHRIRALTRWGRRGTKAG